MGFDDNKQDIIIGLAGGFSDDVEREERKDPSTGQVFTHKTRPGLGAK